MQSVGLVVLAIVPPLCMDGLPPWAGLVTALAGALACVLALWAAREVPWRRAPTLVACALGALGWTACGLVPLPAGLLRALTHGSSPPVAIMHAGLFASLTEGTSPTWLAWTASPQDTRQALVTGAAVLGFTTAAAFAVARGRRRAVLRAVAGSTIATALVVLVHLVLSVDSVYGVVVPEGTMTLPSPLVNENHLAGFLALGVPVCLGLAMSASERSLTIAWLGGAALTSVFCIAALSRGGLLGLGVALVAYLVLVLARQPKRRVTLGRAAIGAFGVVLAVALASYVWWDELVREVGSTTLYKLRLALQGLDLVARNPWLGVGRGGYSAAFVHLHGTETRIEYPECLPVQWAAEWGLPAALALGATLLGLFVRAARKVDGPERAGVLAGLLGLGCHELVDFVTEMPGVLVVTSLAVVAALQDGGTGSGPGRATWRSLWLAVPVLVLVLALFPGVRQLGTSTDDRTAALETRIRAHDWPATDALLRVALAERPGEPEYVALGAYSFVVRRDRRVVRWLNAAMLLAPEWSAPHLLAAQWLAPRHPSQAWLELREVERVDPMRSTGVACALLRRPSDAAEALRVMEHEPRRLEYFEIVMENCASGDATALADVDASLLAAAVPAARRRAAQRALSTGDAAAALAAIDGMSDADDDQTSVVRAEALLRAGRPAEAVEALANASSAHVSHAEILRLRARAQTAAGDADAMRSTIRELQGEAAGSTAAIADAVILGGDLEGELGHRAEAYQAYERADQMDSSRGALPRAYELAHASGDTGRASVLAQRVCARSPGSPLCPTTPAAP